MSWDSAAPHRYKKKDEIGNRYGRLQVIENAGKNIHGQRMWRCKCDCGGEKVVAGTLLRCGRVQSCGCLYRERASNATHGLSKTKEYQLWLGIRSRCNNPNACTWSYYGGRGVKLCDRWNNYANFHADMGDRPKGCSLDRIDNDGDYEPSNCRWVTAKQQAQNRRPSKTHGEVYAMGFVHALALLYRINK